MVDTNVLIRDWFLSKSAITNAIGTGNINGGIYVGDLPESFDAALGPGITISTVSGPPQNPEIPTVVEERIQIRFWANEELWDVARQLYGLIFDLTVDSYMIDRGDKGFIIEFHITTPGQNVTDPDDGWATVLAFADITARSN